MAGKDYVASLRDSFTKQSRETIWLVRTTFSLPTFPGGAVPMFFWADSDRVETGVIQTAPGASSTTTATFLPFGMQKDKGIHTGAQLQVDEMLVAVPNRLVNFSGRQIKLGTLANGDVLDRALVDIFIKDRANPQAQCGWHSRWIAENCTVQRSTVTIQLQSRLAQLKRQTPRTLHGPACNNSLFDPQCGLLKVNFTTSITALASLVPTVNVIAATITGNDVVGNPKGANGYYVLGQLVGTSGVNYGIAREVYSHLQSGTTGTLTLLRPFPIAPNAGDTFNAVPGCDGSMVTCNTKFNNVRGQNGCFGYRATPDIPPLELTFGDP